MTHDPATGGNLPSDGDERWRPVEESPSRALYWWHVPESPRTGWDMLRFILVWFATLVVLAAVIAVVFG